MPFAMANGRDGSEDTGRSAIKIAMTHGPMTTHDRFLAADYQAVKFCHEHLQTFSQTTM